MIRRILITVLGSIVVEFTARRATPQVHGTRYERI